MMRRNNINSFTLVELLIVIAILAILAAAVVIVINPGEMLAQARDAERISSIESLKKSIDLFVLDNPGTTLGTYQKIYISIPDTSATCANITGLPTLPSGWTYNCVTTANLRNLDSTGWLPINLTLIKGGSPMPSLPIDPQNTQATTRYYQYIPGNTSGSYELTTLLESEKQAKIAGKDGGVDPGRLETGTNISLWKTVSGLKGFWRFDEATSGTIPNGTIISDSSASLFNGTAVNTNGTGMSWIQGKTGGGIIFDGTDDAVSISDGNTMNDYPTCTLAAFFKTTGGGRIFSIKRSAGSTHISIYVSGGKAQGGMNSLNNNLASSGSYNDGQWHHVAYTFDGSNAALYVDGKLDNQASGWTLSAPAAEDYPAIGTLTNTDYFTGSIDEMMVYSRALSASEIQGIYNASK